MIDVVLVELESAQLLACQHLEGLNGFVWQDCVNARPDPEVCSDAKITVIEMCWLCTWPGKA